MSSWQAPAQEQTRTEQAEALPAFFFTTTMDLCALLHILKVASEYFVDFAYFANFVCLFVLRPTVKDPSITQYCYVAKMT